MPEISHIEFKPMTEASLIPRNPYLPDPNSGALAPFAGRQRAFDRTDEPITEFPADFNIALGGGMGPHGLMHGRRDEHRGPRHQDAGGEKIVRGPGRQLGQEIRGARSD